MTKCSPNAVIQIATAEIGYLEKKTNAQLDNPTANAGSNNYTKFNRDYNAWGGGGTQPMQWCAAFVSWCFVKAYGLEAAKDLLCGGLHHYTPAGANRFKKADRYIKRGAGTPKVGDVVYFYSESKGRIGHVGIVYKVSNTTVYTIEGNTSGGSTLITNGGGVQKKSYKLTSTYIDGYGRPNYAGITADADDVSLELGDRPLTNGCNGDDVKELQTALIQLGYDCGRWGADGDFGDATELAVEAFQKKHKLKVDGEYGEKTHVALVKALSASEKASKGARAVQIVGGNCWVRSAPNTAGSRLGVAYEGDELTYDDVTSNGWHLVEYNGKNGWVSGKYCKLKG